MTDPNKTIAGMMRSTLLDKGVPQADLHDKISDTKRWWILAGICVLIALLFLVAGFAVTIKVALETHAVPVVLAAAMAAPCGLFVVLAAFCASQASGEATNAFLGALVKLRRGLAGKGDA